MSPSVRLASSSRLANRAPTDGSPPPDRGPGLPAVPAVDDLVGRRPELAAVQRWFANRAAPTTLVLEGDAGLGKTTVWAAAVRSIRNMGTRVLVAAPAEAESRLSYAALADLVSADLRGRSRRVSGAKSLTSGDASGGQPVRERRVRLTLRRPGVGLAADCHSVGGGPRLANDGATWRR